MLWSELAFLFQIGKKAAWGTDPLEGFPSKPLTDEASIETMKKNRSRCSLWHGVPEPQIWVLGCMYSLEQPHLITSCSCVLLLPGYGCTSPTSAPGGPHCPGPAPLLCWLTRPDTWQHKSMCWPQQGTRRRCCPKERLVPLGVRRRGSTQKDLNVPLIILFAIWQHQPFYL